MTQPSASILKWLDEVDAREKAATPGPWEPFDAGPWGGQGAGVAIGKDVENWVCFGKHTTEPHVSNSFFCAHARTDLPTALRMLRKALGALEHIDGTWKGRECCERAMDGDYLSDHYIEHAQKALDECARELVGE